MINTFGLVNSYLGLILPYIAFSLPLVVWIMIGFFDEIPREIDEAALVDGLTRPQCCFACCCRWRAPACSSPPPLA